MPTFLVPVFIEIAAEDAALARERVIGLLDEWTVTVAEMATVCVGNDDEIEEIAES